MERRVVYCLICKTPQVSIARHISTVCRKDSSPDELANEIRRAKQAQDIFERNGRVWSFTELEEFCKDGASCVALCQQMQMRGCIVTDTPAWFQDTEPTLRSTKHGVLEAAKGDIKCLQAMMLAGQSPPSTDMSSFRRYCQAILILGHRLPANVVAEFQVREWLDRKLVAEGAIIQFSGTGAAGRAVTLCKEEESMLDCYFSHVRSIALLKQASGKLDQSRFFLGSDGAPLTNLGSDIIRLREKYTPQKALEMVEAAPTPNPTRHLPAACTPVRGSLPGHPLNSSATATMHAGSRVRHWDTFCTKFPVTVHAEPPSHSRCVEAGFAQPRGYYNKWRHSQLRLRELYILEHATGRKGERPRLDTVQRLLDGEKWGSNRPTAENILRAWMPPQSAPQDDEALLCSVKDQRWRGLALKDFGEGKGLGVIATMPFKHLQVICDYHGDVVSAAEGNQRQQSGYLFFFTAEGGARLCIDATAFPCACHPGMDTFGRRMNHSRRNPNARAQRLTLRYPEGPKEAVIFVALRDISVGEELLWDYGVTRQGFGGEGKDLTWLDS